MAKSNVQRKRLVVKGIVQGVGFRPFIYNLAKKLGIAGWIVNSNEGVVIEAEGKARSLDDFAHLLQTTKPKNASIDDIEISFLEPINENGFAIKKSDKASTPDTIVLPDLATCKECLKDITDPKNRRFHYPFTNCTDCGPRFSIIEKLPYDRSCTTMKKFTMCQACRAEYDDPADRRFHAQPNACPECGPQLALLDSEGTHLASKEEALQMALEQIRRGSILALKGIGGFQLIANNQSIETLRQRKQRPEKPFALMFPSMQQVKTYCHVSETEENLLTSPQAPIVLLKGKSSNLLGIMLPYSPLHHLLLSELNFPVIATSGNKSNEPICIDNVEALSDLKGIADFFLVHDRPIAHAVDDSIVREVAGRKMILRRARGYSSIPLTIDRELPPSVAVGGHMKNTVAAARGKTITISQHIGNLETQKAMNSFSKEINSLLSFYNIEPEVVIADCHPAYFSTMFASKMGKPLIHCQHHAAHVYSCMAEHKLTPPLLGVSFDGTGYGLDQTVWGGEFFLIGKDLVSTRIAHLRPFLLPCGERAVNEPRLSAIGLLYEIFGEELFEKTNLFPIQTLSNSERNNLKTLLLRGFQTPRCSSAGRLFDAIASLIGLRQTITYEGQAAMELEFLSEEPETDEAYPFQFGRNNGIIDWEPMIRQIITEPQNKTAAKFHNTLVEMILAVCEVSGQKQVILTGGVFQNKILTEKAIKKLTQDGYEVFWHEDIPPNDGGISVGQLFSVY